MPTSTLLDRYNLNPFGFWLGCLVWIPIAVWAVSLVHWMVAGEIEPFFGLLALLLAIGLGFVILNPPHPGLQIPLFIAAAAMVPLYPLVRKFLESRELRQIDLEEIEGLFSLAAQNPHNYGAQFKLCERLYEQGMIYHALKIAEPLVATVSKRVYADEIRTFKLWSSSIDIPDHDVRMRCLRCGHVNELDTLFCAHCQRPYLLDHLRGRWIDHSIGLRFLGSWMIAMILLVLLPATATGLRPTLALIVIPLECALAGFLIWTLFVRNRRAS